MPLRYLRHGGQSSSAGRDTEIDRLSATGNPAPPAMALDRDQAVRDEAVWRRKNWPAPFRLNVTAAQAPARKA